MTNTQNSIDMIEAEHLSKFYGEFAAVRDVTFSVTRGEVVAFLGPNGAGKSTCMKLLTGYLSPSEGRARIAGHDMFSDRLKGSRVLGYLPENGPLYPDMTPHGLLTFFADARGLNEIRRKDRMEYVVDLCAGECPAQTDWETVQRLSTTRGHGAGPAARTRCVDHG